MASSRVPTDVLWSAVNSVAVVSATQVWSDAFTFNAEDWDACLAVHADVTGTPSAGDTCEVWISYSADGTTFDTPEHSARLFLLDMVTANTPGEDPAHKTVEILTANPKCKIGVTCPGAGTHTVTVSAVIATHRVA